MRNNIKVITSTVLVLMLVAGIFAALPLTANGAPIPAQGNPAWDAKYAKDAVVIEPALGPATDIPNNPRTDASGDKITSNAHSADYPGLYFYWNDKQKDNGVLLVLPEVFDLFVDGQFTLTAKNSNNYWGYTISPETGTLIDGVYAYGIEKQIKYNEIGNNGKVSSKTDDLKNINMVFIDGEYKSGFLDITKIWLNEDGIEFIGDNTLISFKEGYTLGENTIALRTYAEANSGRKITVTENPIKGFTTLKNPQSVTVTMGNTAELIFTNQKQWANIEIVKVWLDADGNEMVAPEGVEAIFDIVGASVTRSKFDVTEGTYQVKEGKYIVKERLLEGFELISDNNVEITVAAGETGIVTFTNKENTVGSIEIDSSVTLTTITKTILQKWQRTATPYEEWGPTFSSSYSSVTVTNDYTAPLVVVNSNHFTYAKLSVAELVGGVILDMVEGNKYNKVGTAFVQIVDGKLELTINGVADFGAIVFSSIPAPENGVVHSQSGFKHDSNNKIDLPEADTDGYIYLYVHCDSFKSITGERLLRTWTEYGEYDLVFARVIKKDIVTTPVDVTFTVYDSENNVVDPADFGALKPGHYSVEYEDAQGGTFTDEVEVKAGKTTQSSYVAEYCEKAESIIISKYLPDIGLPVVRL
jgi:hypothetical protein